ncbi:amidohydrolase family protein [Dyadobacter frigoris]|uniref:Amidohydrolase n=1 Tax=Dyadobacter frigoris TaxID=2576211 RepID=A0A4V6BJJ9_9BACT|nr:amidohydrolase family protein [Dyadobacter frigoris]TKT92413.1 amidohydrolase [Dyadobacter frigoris]GLU53605.1 amidohydrolase [Dyadobacter frigoris]
MKKVFICFLISLISFCSFGQKIKADLIISDVNIIDIKSGKVISHQFITVEKDLITGVFNQKTAGNITAKKTISGKGKYAIPGLWDMHMHFGGGESLIQENKNLLPLFLAHGITTVRDASADISNSVLQWREEIKAGTLSGPTIFTSGPKLEGYKSVWLGDIEISTAEEIPKALDSLDGLKVDFVKITDNTMKPELFLEAVRQARKRGYKVSGHIPSSLTMQDVMTAGLSSIEHMSYVLRAGTKNEKEIAELSASGKLKGRELSNRILADFDENTALKVYGAMAKHDIYVTPTLSLPHLLAHLDEDNHQNDAYLQYMGKGLQKTYQMRIDRAGKDDKDAIAFRKLMNDKSESLLPLLQKAGVKIMAGTDAGYLNSFTYPGIGLHKELQLMVAAGLTPLQALQASIINPALFLNKKEYGSLVKGKKADILLLDENPLLNISSTQKIYSVVVKGLPMNQTDIKAALDDVKTKTGAGL